MNALRLCILSVAFLTLSLRAEETPKSLGFTFPDEWEDRRGTMMIFPAKHQYGSEVRGLRREFVGLAKAIAQNEPVIVFCYIADEKACRRLLRDVSNVTIHAGDFSIDWARDNAPMVLRGPDGKLASAGFRFNGWGKKYRGWNNDVHTRDNIAKEMDWPIFQSDLVLEGGAIEIGGGVGIVTESCVLNPNRTDWPKEKVERELTQMLGLEKIIWIESGLMPDPITDGHVDGLLKFIAKDTVLLHTTNYKSDINYRITQNAKATLEAHGFKVIELPLADDIVHMNFYIGSGGEVAYVPVCGDEKQDAPALEIIGQFYDKVVPVIANEIGKAGGGVHCFTMQIPR
ncbi:MAG: agmatine deiminase family protein [Symploca sp. SIO2D2]|nr:agmatine deiminase family protein [Symploca sp. SIO2D2]